MDIRNDEVVVPEYKSGLIDKFFNWIESGHWTSRCFCGFMKGMVCMFGVVACVLLLWGTGRNYFKELRCLSD